MKFTDLPTLGAPLEGGAFAGIVTMSDGKHVAVVLLPDRGEGLSHRAAVAWAQERGGQLPTRLIAALLFANAKHLLPPAMRHWCLETEGASFAWGCYFDEGTQARYHKICEGSAVAVRLIPVVESKRQDDALILQLVEALEGYRRNHNDTQPCDAERAGRAWLGAKK